MNFTTPFLQSLSAYGTLADGHRVSLATPPQVRFKSTALEQIRELKAGASSGRWFKLSSTGRPIVSLRNGVALLRIGGSGKLICKDVDAALAYIEAAISAAEAGDLDQLFAETQLKSKQRDEAQA